MSKGGGTDQWQAQSAQNSANTVLSKAVGSPYQVTTPTSEVSAQNIFGSQPQTAQAYNPTFNFSFDNWSPVGGPTWQETQDALNAPAPTPQPSPQPAPAPAPAPPPGPSLDERYRMKAMQEIQAANAGLTPIAPFGHPSAILGPGYRENVNPWSEDNYRTTFALGNAYANNLAERHGY